MKTVDEKSINEIINEYKLEKHPAGCGYYRETFRSPQEIYDEKLGKKRSISTQILTLFSGKQLSPLHKVNATQLVNYNTGNTTLLIKMILEDKFKTLRIGEKQGDKLNAEIPPNTWFALALEDKDESSKLLSTHTVVPGFDFDDFSFASQEDLNGLNEFDKEEALNYLSTQCQLKP